MTKPHEYRNFTIQCDCGNRKQQSVDACERCRFLDGTRPADMDIIAILREVSDGMTVATITAETGRFREAVQKTLQRLRSQGRISAHEDVEGSASGQGRKAYVYKLQDTGKGAA